ncbi:hypothetical protein [Streptomyces sp. NPDC051546]|uniref:hypothetical protein n=1 Tax=Streptomyces sp. NPDC051546 TaxID=3365655 RepID=UPI0037BCDA2C
MSTETLTEPPAADTTGQIAADRARAEMDRRAALDAPKIAKARADAERIERESAEEAGQAAKARAAEEAEEAAEALRKLEVEDRDAKAAKSVRWFAVACFLFAMPLQLLAFWDRDRPFMLLGPLVLESIAWVLMRQAEAAIVARRMVWHYLVGAGIGAAVAATVNIVHGATHTDIGLDFGLVGGFCSVAGPAVWALHEFGARSKTGKATRTERKIAQAEARKAEAELATRRTEFEHRRKADADKREEAESKAREAVEAEAAKVDTQDARRRDLFPQEWETYERIIAAHPLGSILRDRAWSDARRAHAHPKVWARYEHLLTAAPTGIKLGALWEIAWRSVHGLPVGQTIETLTADIAARAAVEESLFSAELDPGRFAIDAFLDDIFPPSGTDEKAGKNGRGKGDGKGDEGTTALGRKGNAPSGRRAPKVPDKPLDPADLDKVRELADALRDVTKLSLATVRAAVGGGNNEYLVRLRDHVKAERKNAR